MDRLEIAEYCEQCGKFCTDFYLDHETLTIKNPCNFCIYYDDDYSIVGTKKNEKSTANKGQG